MAAPEPPASGERIPRARRLSNTWVRIAASYTLLVLLTAGVLILLLGDDVVNREEAALRTRLSDQARAVGYAAEPLFVDAVPLTATNTLAHAYSSLFATRVTLIRPDGVVVGDSEEDPRLMENHAGRPEVQAVLADPLDPGSSRRLSATVHRELLYVAVAVVDPAQPGRVVGVARVAYPLTSVEQARQTLWSSLATAVLLVSVAAALLGVLLVRSFVGPLSTLRDAAYRFGRGELSARARLATGGEIGELSREFDTMADQLSATIHERTAERNQIAAVLTHMHDGIILTDAQGTIRQINPAAGRLFRTTPERAAGRSLVEVTHSHELHQGLRGVLTRPGDRQRVEVTAGNFQVAAVVTAIPGFAAGGPTVLFVLQDVSELRRLERVRRDFVANIGHELRTPLASIKLLVETLMDAIHDDPAAAEDFLQRIDVEVDGLTQLVRELLELSRIESGQVQLARRPVAAGPLLERAAGRLRTQAQRAGLTLSVQDVSGLPLLDVDADRIEQVLVNLIHNAIKFTPEGGITICAEPQDGMVRVSVRDTGIGIPPDDLPRIFERFYKVDKARSGGRAREGGTGLGLAIAKHIVQAHGGEIWAVSPREGGSIFYFTLPVAS